MNATTSRRTFFTLVASLAAVILVGCEKESDVSLIRKLGLRAVAAAEAHDVGAIMELVTKGFKANPGAHSQDDVRPILFLAFRRYAKFRILHPKFTITIDPSGGSATLKVPFFVLREGQKFDARDLEGLEDDPIAWAKKIAEKLGDPYYLQADLTKGDAWKVDEVSLIGFRSLQDFR